MKVIIITRFPIRFPLCYYTSLRDITQHNMMMMMSIIILTITAVAMTIKNTTVTLLKSLTLNIKSKRVIFHLPN
jgi:hypothetical protein